MRNILFIACAIITALCTGAANAGNAMQLTLTVTQDQARIADALAVLQQETGFTIIVDSTVIGRMRATKVSFTTLPKMLDFLKTMEPGLTYAQLFIGGHRPTPSAQECFDLVRTMEWLSEQGNPILVSPVGTISIVRQKTRPATMPPGMREIWYVSDDRVRAQQLMDQQKISQDAALNAAPAASSPAPSSYMNQAPGQSIHR